MTRLEALKARCLINPYQKLAKRLSEAEFDEVVTFIEEHEALGHLEFEDAVNRRHIDKVKPKNWPIIQELLLVTNTIVKGKTR